MDVLIDDCGKVWDTGSPALVDHLGAAGADCDLVAYLLRNLGFARLRSRGGGLFVSFRRRALARSSFETLVWLMVREDAQRFAVQVVGSPDRLEVIAGVEDAVARIEELSLEPGPSPAARYSSEALSLDRLRHPRLSQLRTLLRTWQAARGRLASELDVQDQICLQGRSMLVRMDRDGPVVERVGRGYTCFDRSWEESIAGRPVEDQPDPAYGQRIARACHRTQAVAQPQLDFVEATVRIGGQSQRRLRYERLMLPWRTARGSFVSTSSVLRTSFMEAAT